MHQHQTRRGRHSGIAVAMILTSLASACGGPATGSDAITGDDAGADAAPPDGGPGTDAAPTDAGPGTDASVVMEGMDFPDNDLTSLTVFMSLANGPTVVEGTIAAGGDLDLIGVTGMNADPVVIDVMPGPGSSLDPDVLALDLFGGGLNYNDDGPAPPAAHIENNVPAPGTFAISVAGVGGTSGTYTVVLSAGSYSPITTAMLADDNMITEPGTKMVPGSTLYFEVPTTGTTKCVTVNATTAGPMTPYLLVLNTAFEIVASSNDLGLPPFPPVSFNHPVVGMDQTLRIAVQDYDGTASAAHLFDLTASAASGPCP